MDEARLAKIERRAETALASLNPDDLGAVVEDHVQDLIAEVKRLNRVAQFLFARLDDIDTVSDMAKDDDAAYRREVERIQHRRFEVGSTDGYRVSFSEKLEPIVSSVAPPKMPT